MKKFIIILLVMLLSITILWIRAEVQNVALSEEATTLRIKLTNTQDSLYFYRDCNDEKLVYIDYLEGLEEIAENTIYANCSKYGSLCDDLKANGYNELLDSLNAWIGKYE